MSTAKYSITRPMSVSASEKERVEKEEMEKAMNERKVKVYVRPMEKDEDELIFERNMRWAEEGEGDVPLQFALPRKKCSEMAPELERIRTQLPLQDDSSENQTKLPTRIQHRYHLMKTMMRTARVENIQEKFQILSYDFDESERYIHAGLTSKKIFDEIFVNREFDLYGNLVGARKYQSFRKHEELKGWAEKYGIEYTQLVDPTLADNKPLTFKEKQARIDKVREDAMKLEMSIGTEKPKLTTEKWELERMEKFNNPAGFSQNPLQPFHSMGNEKFFSYNGQWRFGRMHGLGTYLFRDDCKYEGQFKDNKPHGMGKTVYPSGQMYTGNWVNGRYENKGNFTGTCGSYYEGQYEFGRRHGVGKLELQCGLTYEGEHKDGKPHGRGVMSSKRTGYSYDGNFRNGNVAGSGTLVSPQGMRLLQYWPEQDSEDFTLPQLVRNYLEEKADERAYFDRQKAEVFGPLRGSQLKQYVTDIRNSIYNERMKIKKDKLDEQTKLMREQKAKLHEARVRALIGSEESESEK